jgi:lycopene cyclase domain-containing protein
VEALTYIAMIAVWGLPVIALQWCFGWRSLMVAWRPLVVTVVMATVYLGFAGVAGLRDGIWEINPSKTIALRGGGFVVEEWLLFLVTNVMIAQMVIIGLDGNARDRARKLLRRR